MLIQRKKNIRKRRVKIISGIICLLILEGIIFMGTGIVLSAGRPIAPFSSAAEWLAGIRNADPGITGFFAAVFSPGDHKAGMGAENGGTDPEESMKEGMSGEEEPRESDENGSLSEEDQTEMFAGGDTEESRNVLEAVDVVAGYVDDPVYVTLVAVGDNLMHRSVSMSGLQADGSYNYSYNFSKIRSRIEAADIAVINQETVIGGNELGIQGYPTFNGRTEMADTLVNVGFDVILAANNHILDQGVSALQYMISYFKTYYPQITLLGIHESWESRDLIRVVEKNGIRIAMINYTDLLNIPSFYTGSEYTVDYLDYDRLAALIRTAKSMSDFVIVFPHWGTEYVLSTDEKQAQEAAFLAQQGVDLVIGTHPHVVEPVSYITRPDGGRMLIYYSLGNYQSIQNKEATMIGGMAQVTICKNYNGVYISDFNMEFLANDYRMSPGYRDYYDIVTTYPWEQYTRELAESSWVHHDNSNFNIDYMFQLEASMQAQVTAERQAAGLQ